MDLLNKSDNSSWNQSITAEAADLPNDYGVIGYILSALMMLEFVACWLMNILVFMGIHRIGEDRLKVGFLMKNTIAGDMLSSLSIAAGEIFRLTGVSDDSKNHTLDILCLNAVYDILGFPVAFYQVFATMAVALDRFFSILRPLAYHSMRYSKTSKAAIVFLTIFISLGISLPLAVLKLGPNDTVVDICYKTFETTAYTREFLPYFLITCVFLTLLIYCSLFVVIAYHRYKTRDSLAPQNEKQKHLGHQTSLVVTFFFVHITYVLLYIPGAMFYSIIGDSNDMTPVLFYTSQLCHMVYMANSLVDPLIYIFRVPAVRDSVRTMVCRRSRSANAQLSTTTKAETETVDSALSSAAAQFSTGGDESQNVMS